MKTYAIGDLHGRYDLLEKAIEAIETDSPEGGRFIICGDFVDRGPQSKEIIQRLIAGPSSDKWEWITLQGNHEAMMIGAYYQAGNLLHWLYNGGGATLASYSDDKSYTYPLPIDRDHISWLIHRPVYFEDENHIFVHAGVPHDELVTETDRGILQWMLHDGDIPNVEGYEDLPNISGKHIVHGHHQSDLHPLRLPHRTNLDTFAWHSGRLAIGVFDETHGPPLKIIEVKVEEDE